MRLCRYMRVKPWLVRSWFGIPRLNPAQFVWYEVAGDGSCFFHSLLAACNTGGYRTQKVKTQQEWALRLRRNFAGKYDRKFHDEVSDDDDEEYDEVRKKMGQLKEWATEPMILFTMRYKNMSLAIYDVKNRRLVSRIWPEDFMTRKCVLILWVNHEHFEVLLFRHPVRKVLRGFLDPADEVDRWLMEHMYKAWSDGGPGREVAH